MTPFLPLQDCLRSRPAALKKGPLAIILIEDDSAVAETLFHHVRLGFHHVLALSPRPVTIPDVLAPQVTNVAWHSRQPDAHQDAVNAIIRAVPEGTWLFCCFNAEFLFFPFSETRSVGELLAFHAEERRDAMLCYLIDLYARDLTAAPDGVSLSDAMFDGAGYYALDRRGADGVPVERELEFHGGLRWRFEEHVPPARRRISRIALFRAARGLRMDGDHRFNVQEYNTHSCPWHHNLTAAVASFRAAKALATNPGSRQAVASFCWGNSRPFEWRAQQLMDLGLMEPGQWF